MVAGARRLRYHAEEMTQAPAPPARKHQGRFLLGMIVVLGLVGIAWFSFFRNGGDDPEPDEPPTKQTPATIEEPKPEPVVEEPPEEDLIPGLAAADVYGKLKSNGFKIKEERNVEGLMTWTCEDSLNPDTTYRAEITARSETQVVSVSGTVVNFGSEQTASVAKPFLEFFATLSHAESNPNAASKWLAGSLDQIGATTRFGEVTYTISGDERTRILQLRPDPTAP
jgi:hypothetical protein